MHTLYTWDLHHAHVGFALFFLQLSEIYCRVKKLERIVNGLRDSRCVIFKELITLLVKFKLSLKKLPCALESH